MSRSRQPFPDRVYAALLRLLPLDFRTEFGGDMQEVFYQQRMETASRYGFSALLRMWGETVADVVRMAPREHLSVLSQDVAYALRMMRQNLGYTAAATLILSLGIGINTSIFSVVNSVILKPLPYAQGDGLVVIRQSGTRTDHETMGFSVPEIEDYRRDLRSLDGLVEYHSMVFTLLGPNEAHRVRTGVVSAGFFDLFGVRPLLGRTFVPADDLPGAPSVLVLSYEYWKDSAGADPTIVGRMFEMNDRPHRVIGVLPPIPQYPRENDVYMPVSSCPFRSRPANIANRNYHLIASLFGRIKPSSTVEHCRAELAQTAREMATAHPDVYPASLGFRAAAASLKSELTDSARPMLFVLLAASGLVLLIACANVANLILARMSSREQELVIRSAMGAGSGRLLRQLLTENLLLALIAAAAGMIFAKGSLELLVRFVAQLTPRAREIAIDGRVFAFAMLCASVTTIAFGSAAALHSRKEVACGFVSWGLKEGSRAGADRRRSLLRALLLAAQVAFCYVLLIGAGLLVRSFIQLTRVDPGYLPQRIHAVGFELNWTRYDNNQKRREMADRLLARIRTQTGVAAVAVASSFPMDPDLSTFGRWSLGMRIEGDPRLEAALPLARSVRSVSPDYFRILAIPLAAGRLFTDGDTSDAPPVIILNRGLAASLFGNADPIGRRMSFNRGRTWLRIVGIVGDTKEFGPAADPPHQVYLSMAQEPMLASVLVQTAADGSGGDGMAGQLRRAVLELDAQTAITRVKTLDQARADSVSWPRNTARVFGCFAVLALLIAVTGIGSMLALWVRLRTREIGIRMAMGAGPREIVRTVIRQGMVLAFAGVGIGIGVSLLLTRFLRRFLFQVEPTDAATFGFVSALLLAASLAACYVPARRAARIDPKAALRAD